MKTTMMAGVCLLAMVLTFTIAECGPSQEKRQEPSYACNEEYLQDCVTGCEQSAAGNDAILTQCEEICETTYGCEDSGATAIAGATIFSTISALLVAVSSAMN